jgi:rare lipoprotein A (peptidoglycan hydrolase)
MRRALAGMSVVVVVVNDRGPHTEGLLMDLGGAAADELGMKREGRVEMRLEILAGAGRPGPRRTP